MFGRKSEQGLRIRTGDDAQHQVVGSNFGTVYSPSSCFMFRKSSGDVHVAEWDAPQRYDA
jgi:hypothetical protein